MGQPVAERPLAFQGRGVYYFAGRVPCPLAGVGKRPPDHSNRVALDDEHTQVIIDRPASRIVVRNDHRYPDKAIIADLMFLAQARTEAGETVPAGVHVKLEKKGDEVEVDLHPHWTVRDKLVSAVLETFDIVQAQRQGDKVLVTGGDLAKRVRGQQDHLPDGGPDPGDQGQPCQGGCAHAGQGDHAGRSVAGLRQPGAEQDAGAHAGGLDRRRQQGPARIDRWPICWPRGPGSCG